ncbi:MAG: hypothetical protein ACI9WU_002678 [Myxococcota bacterium]|jgi:hypothetical protein
MRRRNFIRTLGGAGIAAGLGAYPRSASAAPLWGDYPSFALPAILPEGKRAKNVLDIFLYGGLCPWETFYVVPEYGVADKHMWWTFQDGNEGIPQIYQNCYGDAAPPILQDWMTDDLGAQVRLGPFTEPLRSRQDIISRMRAHVVTHTLEPHEAAIPFAMSGYRLGDPKLAGVGAAVQHYYQARTPTTTGEPFAYVLFSPGDFPTDNLRSASAVGQHPGSSRPLSIRVQADTSFIEALKRGAVEEYRPQFDAMLNYYSLQYRNRMYWPGASSPTRANTFGDYKFSLDTLQQTDSLINILEPQYFGSVGGSACGQSNEPNYPRMGLKLASHLLNRPDSQARYVCVVDGGLITASGGGGYDTHNKHIKDSARNLTNLWQELNDIINEPGENDPSKLNLDETMVCINTEFGRSPWAQNDDGRNHHPYAYVTMMFGGPIGQEETGLVGAIDENGYAVGGVGPAESRAAILAALGIYPFAPENYAVSQVYGTGTETEASMWLKEGILGVTS